MNPLRVLVVDDHPALLRRMVELLESLPEAVVVGQARSGPEALEAAKRLRPDLALVDLTMPGMNGLETTRQLLTTPEPPTIVLLADHDTPAYRAAAQAAGARELLVKADLDDQLPPLLAALRRARSADQDKPTTDNDPEPSPG